jgi:hypothetical protein
MHISEFGDLGFSETGSGRVRIDAGGREYPVEPEVATMFECDAQHVGPVDGDRADAGSVSTVESEGAEPNSAEPHGAEPPGSGKPSITEPHAADVSTRDHVARTRPRDRPHTGASTAPLHPDIPRATQTIPPSIRRAVIRRHRGRCAVPGCQNHLYVDIHHIDPSCEGGTHDPERLTVLCAAHHRATHFGSLPIDGRASIGFVFRHADGRRYGELLDPRGIEVAHKVLRALINLGFKRSQAEQRIRQVQRDGAPRELETFLRTALQAA